MCGFQCHPGYEASGGACVRVVEPPRPVAPQSASTVTSTRPTLRWALAPTTDGAELEVCPTRACDSGVQTIEVGGDRYTFASDLAPGVHFWRLRGRAAGKVGAPIGPTWELFVGHHGASIDTSGGVVADFNGDGYADVAVADPGPGRLYVYWGGPKGVSESQRLAIPMSGAGSFVVSSVGDLNGDGFSDLAVTDPSARKVYVFNGGLTGLAASPSVTLSPPVPAATDGGSASLVPVAAAGDLNGDGYGDLVLGGCSANKVEVYHGGAQGVSDAKRYELLAPAGAAGFGCALAGAADIDGDGYDDLVVGAPKSASSTGAAFVYLGGPGDMSQTPSLPIPGPSIASAQFGQSLALGDLNGDGYADLVVGAPGAGQGAGEALVFYGSSAALPVTPSLAVDSPDARGGGFGSVVAFAGDTNADGFGDFVVASPGVGSSNSVGAVHLYLGGVAGAASTPSLNLVGPDGYSFGAALTAGDYNGDGIGDLAVGSLGANKVYVFPGAADGVAHPAGVTLVGPDGSAGMGTFGRAIARAPVRGGSGDGVGPARRTAQLSAALIRNTAAILLT
jgi:hypothetical protein